MEPNNTNPQTPPVAQNPAPQAPFIPESEMKLPEESVVGTAVAPESSRHLFNPLLIALLVLLLAALAVVIIWGEDLIELVLPSAPIDQGPTMEEQARNAELDALTKTENDLEAIDLSQPEAQMNAIEAEIIAEVNATGTATSTAN